jgi:hypothetical protein
MLEEIITFHVEGETKKIRFPSLPLRMWRFHNGTTQSELMKERWKDSKFRKKASKKTYKLEDIARRRKQFKEYRNSEDGKLAFLKGHYARRGKPRNVLHIPDSLKRRSPFYMIDGVDEEVVEMDRVDLSHGVVIESQLRM